MRPTLEARGLKESLLQYLSTTYALADEGAREALHRFLGDESEGMFRGPYLRIRTPFRPADAGWQDVLDWHRAGFTPYAHQAAAFRRLSAAGGRAPQPTLVTTGTGSGKTEAFLYPVLDHCARAYAAGHRGIKAVLLYPMNALATDQAQRLDDLLRAEIALRGLRGGLYVGDRPATRYETVWTNRADMRLTPPDVLITNYKMLDLLLSREADRDLWRGADIRYVVVDEFHTYDGAQGTDVAILLRRLAAAVGSPEPGRPLGPICPVATSATLASGVDDEARRPLLDVAAKVFGVAFDDEAIVGEDRLTVDEFVPRAGWDGRLPMPTPDEIVALSDPTTGDRTSALAELAEAITGRPDLDPRALGDILSRHPLTSAILTALDGGARTSDDVLNLMWRHGAFAWARAVVERPEVSADALARVVALFSTARDPRASDTATRPFVHVEVHQWARSVSRLLRGVLPGQAAEFRWDAPGNNAAFHARNNPLTAITTGQAANLFLPAVYCRDCGRSGWAVFSPESDDDALVFDSHRIRRASTSGDKVRVRSLIAATDEEAREGSGRGVMDPAAARRSPLDGPGGTLMVLDGPAFRLRPPDPAHDYEEHGAPKCAARDTAFVHVNLGDTANTAAENDWCPACGERNAIRYIGTGPAAIAAASITQMFTGGELDRAEHEDKTLMFTDSVQDAAHRAGFVSARSHTFSLRALLAGHLGEDRPIALHDLFATVVEGTTDQRTLAAVVPPDLRDQPGVARLLAGTARGRTAEAAWRTVGDRLSFDTVMEFGFRSRNGRTLELTRTAVAEVHLADPAAAVEAVRRAHLELGGQVPDPQNDSRYRAFLRVFLERLRTRGGVHHQWLDGYLAEAGTNRYRVWGGRPAGMRAFPKGVAAPRFLLAHPKQRSEFDVASGRLTWYEQWARRCLGITREQSPELWNRLLMELAATGVVATRHADDGATRLYGLQPGHVRVQLVGDDAVNTAFVRCPTCSWEQTVHPARQLEWHGQPCPSYRCRGRLVAGAAWAEHRGHRRDRDHRRDYYRDLYRRAGTYQVVTAEHTGLLTRAAREKVETAFRRGQRVSDPNVLACTPTLEMGIDIGDLSAVVLAALPRGAANYAQQVGRAGRRTGNAFLLTIPDRSRRDMYYLERPEDMISGRITPPGCYLSAVEILRRQYLAHLLDLAAGGRLLRPDGHPVSALPPKAPQLFGPSGHLVDLVDCALARGARIVETFLGLFPAVGDEPTVDRAAVEALTEFATSGLSVAVKDAEGRWQARGDDLRARLELVADAIAELNNSDPEHVAQKAELDGEQRALRNWLHRYGDTDAQTALVELGLLPNYALVDTVTRLDATLWSSAPPAANAPRPRPELRSYERPRRYALAELAPGNAFYAAGYKHEISGIEIGSAERPQWQVWRFCPSCGFVRTEDAAEDRTPCPRCGGAGISDDGACLHRVIEPEVVTSRSRREDARISDERDERDRVYYTEIDAVDIASVEPGSWRHSNAVFGVDVTRNATIRRVNVGRIRDGRRPDDHLAGHTVRLSPFEVCTACGAATADGRPVVDTDPDASGSSAANRDSATRHHLPWCPLRRGRPAAEVAQQPVLLVHQLRTEALRILLPAATMLVDERVQSFRAALRLGVDRHFGGDPQHLDATTASMPDRATSATRHYLVLYDTLPGGTGYLHRLAEPEAFRQTLLRAREALLECPCRAENRAACHRCLHRHTDERHQDLVSRRVALDILGELLGPVDEHGVVLDDRWRTEPVSHAGLIGLEAQMESDLETRFLTTLREVAASRDRAAFDEDADGGELRFTGTERVVRWQVRAQHEFRFTRADLSFRRIDGPPRTVAVFLDGARHHAAVDRNRIASDAASRARLRADGVVVIQITWADLDRFEEGRASGAPWAWLPTGVEGRTQAAATSVALGGDGEELADAVLTDAMSVLLAYLRDPEPLTWQRRVTALVSSLMRSSEPLATAVDRTGTGDAVLAGFRASSAPAGANPGPSYVGRAVDDVGLPLIYVLDTTSGQTPESLVWSAIAVLDDGPDLATEPGLARWRSWLRWTNLLPFLDEGHGDGIGLTTSQVPSFDVATLAACAGTATDGTSAGGPQVHARSPRAHSRDQAWDDEILDLLEPDEESMIVLARALADRGKSAPVFGYELGEHQWPIDFAWPALKVGVAGLGVHSEENRRRDEAYEAAGWTVLSASAWLNNLDALANRLPDAPEARR